MRAEILFLILAMGAVTYLPRLLPAVLLERMHISNRLEKFLKLIPYTAMAALVFPGIFTVDPSHWYIGALGGLVAILLAWRKLPIIVTVLGAVASLVTIYAIR